MLLFDIVGFFKLFVSLLDFFLEYFVLFIKAVVLFVEIVFFLLDPAFLTGNFSAALFKFLIKLGTALLDLFLCIEKCDLFLIFCSFSLETVCIRIDRLCRSGGVVSAKGETIPSIFHGRQLR